MRIPVKLFGFVFWLFSLNCAQCQDIRCEVPHDQHVYRPHYYFSGDMKFGAKQYYSCMSGYDQMAAEATCTRDGWTPKPLCVDIKCEVPHDQHVYRPYNYFSEDMKFGAKQYYSCMSGYDQMAAKATCTRDGWTPKPLCVEKMCAAPNIANAKIVGEQRPKYKISSRIHYKCNPGFEPEQPVQITCNPQTEWTGILQCTEKCGLPPQVDFAGTTKMTKNEYSSGEKVEYSCFYTYILDQNHPYSKYLTCEQGQWRGNIRCLKPCSVTVEEMDKRGIQLRWGTQENKFPPHSDQMGFECQKGKKFNGDVNDLRQTCNDGVMNLPQCV